MGMLFIQPAHAGTRFRDDYGAALALNATFLTPVMQSSQVAAQGGLKHVA
ncbi:hypothetical protein [Candidatus Pantoea deserta]|nr:hypothetical protein [Pantoea deserta]